MLRENNVYNDTLLKMTLSGSGYQGIIDFLAQKLCTEILIENEFFCVLARSHSNKPSFSQRDAGKKKLKYSKPQYLDPKIREYVTILNKTLRPVKIPELPEYGVKEPRVVFPITVRNKIKAYLNVFKTDFNNKEMAVINVALNSLLLLETVRYVQTKTGGRIIKSLIFSLTNGDENDIKSNINIVKETLKIELFRETYFALVKILSNTIPKENLEDALRSIRSDLNINAIVTTISKDQGILLIQSDDVTKLKPEAVNDILRAVFEALKMIFPGCRVKIGVGRQCFKYQDYKLAFEEANNTLFFTGSSKENEEGVFYHHSLRLMHVLLETQNLLPGLVRDILGKLHNYDVERNINLIESIECYLKHDCNIQSAARELFIHPNTLRYRIEKAEKISGLDLTDNDTKLELQLAIKLYKYQGETIFV